ncbi:MAG: DNA mismatch repair endonuclease MutL [Deltaproteobacteria bacterium]|nr:DNA mismatch repair endonuclease MutL [Deltaproteobacteria bacterium]
MGTIHLLADNVINHIAAGEVVERPASVVKELLENALDAGADRITVLLEDGGRESIVVLDNGRGMDPADARLACTRHATSKISTPADLEKVATLGFRGEALASIAAVSRFELLTCADESQGGTRINMEGGREVSVAPQGFAQGTRVTVRELFFNTPARRKFLRVAATELQAAQNLTATLALAHTTVHFTLTHHGRVLYDLTPCATLAERAFQVFGGEFAEGMLPLDVITPQLRMEGVVSLPSQAKSSRRWQYLYINHRPVKNAGLNHAVYQAYRTLLMKDRHPAYILKLFVEPAEVDVNVHPAKTEVRLRNPQLLHTLLADRLHQVLMDGARQRAFGESDPGISRRPPPPRPSHQAPAGSQLELTLKAAQERVGESAPTSFTSPSDPHLSNPNPISPNPSRLPTSPALASIAGPAGSDPHPLTGEAFHFQPLHPAPAAEAPMGGGLRLLGQHDQTYLLVARGEDLLVVDQHAAHERVLFEAYRTQYYQGRLQSQTFLVPPTLELSPANSLLLEQYLPQWERLGFQLEPFGGTTFLVRAVPALLARGDISALVLDVLDDLALFGKSGRVEEVINDILERVACHAAVRAGQSLAKEEMESLVARLEGLDMNLYCPHGRPVWVEISQRELEKRFKRIV